MQIPLAKGMTPDDDIAIVAADENKMTEDNLNVDLEVLPGKPKLLGTNLIFEVSHFSMLVIFLHHFTNESSPTMS